MRVEATSENVDKLFAGVMVEINEPFIGRVRKPGWKCRKCGWQIVTQNLPIPHECPAGSALRALLKQEVEEQMKVNVKKCERCGQDHDGLELDKLVSPVIVDNEYYHYVGQCPVTKERVFMEIISDAANPCPHAEAMARIKEKGEQNGN